MLTLSIATGRLKASESFVLSVDLTKGGSAKKPRTLNTSKASATRSPYFLAATAAFAFGGSVTSVMETGRKLAGGALNLA
ncbi:hypothetical protein [Accumulibacter sp.]|uniref:hypothetical protein n=1 Tax=Accumulibacter sp. TaxID=2053492 RepID=UPI0028C47707|nr:hypothetical protein [Accumulibacter sp.]